MCLFRRGSGRAEEEEVSVGGSLQYCCAAVLRIRAVVLVWREVRDACARARARARAGRAVVYRREAS